MPPGSGESMVTRSSKPHRLAPSAPERQRRYGDAARQYAVLLKSGNSQNTDFYTYRYLASKGFPARLQLPSPPLMAWICARRANRQWSGTTRAAWLTARVSGAVRFGPRSLAPPPGPHVPGGARENSTSAMPTTSQAAANFPDHYWCVAMPGTAIWVSLEGPTTG